MRSLPIDRCKIDCLCTSAHIGRYVTNIDIKDDCSRLTMNVSACIECFDKCRILRQMREQPQLDLRVVSSKQLPSGSRNKSATDSASELSPDRNVLKIRLAR